jgi:hypothetical protein
VTTVVTIEQLEGIFRRVHRALRSFHGVRYVDIGYRVRNDRRTGKLALRLFVERKRARTKSIRLAPPTIEGVRLDVIECKMTPHRGEFVGGSYIYEQGFGAGTMGAVFSAPDGASLLALTARHVCPDVGTAVFWGHHNAQTIGKVSSLNYDLGASVITLEPGVSAKVGDLGPLGKISRFPSTDDVVSSVSSHAKVRKNGATTGVTKAQVTGFNPVDDTITISASDGKSTIADGGDSGAIWVTGDGVALALHVGGDGPHAVGMFVGPMQAAFGLSLG